MGRPARSSESCPPQATGHAKNPAFSSETISIFLSPFCKSPFLQSRRSFSNGGSFSEDGYLSMPTFACSLLFLFRELELLDLEFVSDFELRIYFFPYLCAALNPLRQKNLFIPSKTLISGLSSLAS